MTYNNVSNIHASKLPDKWSDSEIKKAATKSAQKFGNKITETWIEGKGNPVQQLDEAIDLMQFKPTPRIQAEPTAKDIKLFEELRQNKVTLILFHIIISLIIIYAKLFICDETTTFSKIIFDIFCVNLMSFVFMISMLGAKTHC